VSASSQQLSAAAQQTNSSVQQVSTAIQQVAKGAQTLAQRASETTKVMDDLNMPGLNGIETLRELREIDKEVPVYFQTAFHAAFTDQMKRAAEDDLGFEILRKPLSNKTDCYRLISLGCECDK
jgi:CheY-like chemotaxis protein